MEFIYTVGHYVGYFFVLIIFLILAIILSKKLYSWIFYLIGSVITFMSISGTQKSYENSIFSEFYQDKINSYWDIYVILLSVSAVIMICRYLKAKAKDDEIAILNNSSNTKIRCDKCFKETDGYPCDFCNYIPNNFECNEKVHNHYKKEISDVDVDTPNGIWKYNEIVDEKVFICKHCNSVIAYESDFENK